MRRIALVAATAVLAATAFGAQAAPADAAPAKTFKNCTELNESYPHGVGKKGARDLNSKGKPVAKPVKNFKVDNALYEANKKSDRDKDGIACEKH